MKAPATKAAQFVAIVGDLPNPNAVVPQLLHPIHKHIKNLAHGAGRSDSL